MPLAQIVLLATCALVAATNGWISPKYAIANAKYNGDLVWALGSSQVVAFFTNLTSYRVEIWQQDITRKSAKRATQLVYNQTAGQDLPQSFYWTVQTYELQLSDSPVFFFWLRDNNSSTSATSPYFNITVQAVTSSIPSSITSTVSSATSIATSSSDTPLQNGATATAAPSAGSTSPVSSPSSSNDGISKAAVAGIVAGSSIAGVLIFMLAGLLLWRRYTRSLMDTKVLSSPTDSQGQKTRTDMMPVEAYVSQEYQQMQQYQHEHQQYQAVHAASPPGELHAGESPPVEIG